MIPTLIAAGLAVVHGLLVRRYYRGLHSLTLEALKDSQDTVIHALALANILLAGIRVPKQAIKDLKEACEKALDVGPELARELVKDAEAYRDKQKTTLN